MFLPLLTPTLPLPFPAFVYQLFTKSPLLTIYSLRFAFVYHLLLSFSIYIYQLLTIPSLYHLLIMFPLFYHLLPPFPLFTNCSHIPPFFHLSFILYSSPLITSESPPFPHLFTNYSLILLFLPYTHHAFPFFYFPITHTFLSFPH